jgi:hypothetical protein
MFDRLKGRLDAIKDKADQTVSQGTYRPLVDAIIPKVTPIFEKACELAPGVVADDSQYRSYVVEPAWLAVTGLTGGVSSLIPNLHERFSAALFHARAELLVVDASTNRVSLVDGALDRLPHVLVEGISKPLPRK